MERPFYEIDFSQWRVGDQKIYISDLEKFSRATGWRPRVTVKEGVARLYRWLLEHAVIDESDLADQGALLNHGAIH